MGGAMSRETTPLRLHEPFDEWSTLAAVGALDDEDGVASTRT